MTPDGPSDHDLLVRIDERTELFATTLTEHILADKGEFAGLTERLGLLERKATYAIGAISGIGAVGGGIWAIFKYVWWP